jgi:hypothetical protein
MKKRLRLIGSLMVLAALVFTGCPNLVEGETITGVTVSPSTATAVKGGTMQFSAIVVGTESPAQTVIWSIDGTHKVGTLISDT